ncbi:solute carrier family 35 member G1 isoform X2 [Gouania willdenowi]|uniref:solute carrier family 35 member G1 isoform X2 n=1 Tax=Gouania willdenowi TaxID=441366 RepID=UPI0010569D3D|nr:solute carrier family 35 member G1 isoform X2 [Gouania willdenowi]
MGDQGARERPLSAEDGVTVAFFHQLQHGSNDREDDSATETVCLQSDGHMSSGYSDAEVKEGVEDEEGGRRQTTANHGTGGRTLCPPAFCVTSKRSYPRKSEAVKPKRCPGRGLCYAFMSTVLFSIIALLVKTIEDIHAIEISAIRCLFQMLFIAPILIYNKISFIGPRDKLVFLVFRGFFGSNAMILLFYAFQQMPLADATVIMFSNPVFTSLLAWIFLKEKCTLWDCAFTVFTITGVILIARPPFIFGKRVGGIEGEYTNHIKGTIAAFGGAIGAACTFVIVRKLGKSVHYYLSIWYYAVIGLIQCIIGVSFLGEWKLPSCGRDRWMMLLIAVLGIGGQTLLIKALQIEKAGLVALMRTVDVVLAFIFQFIFFNRAPTLWSLGGALCIVASTSGVALRKWYSNSRKR